MIRPMSMTRRQWWRRRRRAPSWEVVPFFPRWSADEDREQNDDRDRYAEKPKENSATHFFLHQLRHRALAVVAEHDTLCRTGLIRIGAGGAARFLTTC